MKRIAIYSRKSKFTGKGDSIENQIQLCKEYANKYFDTENVTIFEDEGFSGGTTNRPQFQLLLQECKEKKFDVLICYRLDRISRNIADFATLIDDLQQYDIAFVSIREQFDTSTPMGRAMMYIASVFAQLERETIAERIRDNMMQLAKTGRWLGGVPPTGFCSKEIITIDGQGNQRKSQKLSIVEDEIEQVKLLFDKFLELKSLYKLEKYCLTNNIKSKNGNSYSCTTLKAIIENPVYVICDENIINFLEDQGHEICVDLRDCNEEKGLMVYNKTTQVNKSPKSNNIWTVALGQHKGIITSDTFIKASELRHASKDKGLRKRTIDANALLSGVLMCKCGSFMRKAGTRVNKNGTTAYYYMCELKAKTLRERCNCKNIRGDKLDQLVIDELKAISRKESAISKSTVKNKLRVDKEKSTIKGKLIKINENITKNDKAIENLVKVISEGEGSLAAKHLLNQINKLEEDNSKLKKELLELNRNKDTQQLNEDGLDVFQAMLVNFKDVVDTSTIEEQKKLIRVIVDKIYWDGKDIDIVLFGAKL